MPTITANTSTQVSLPAGQDINGTGAGTALVGNGAAGAIPLTNGSPWQIGPFAAAQTVHITAASAITYAVEDPLADPVRFTVPQVNANQALVLGGGVDVAGSRTITNAGPIVMGSIVIPGGTMGPNGILIVEGRWITDTNAHNRTLACRFGGQTFASSLLSASGAVVNPFRIAIANRGVQNSQSSHPSGSNGMDATGASLTLGTVNTAVDQTLELVGTVATYSLTLEHFIVSVRNV